MYQTLESMVSGILSQAAEILQSLLPLAVFVVALPVVERLIGMLRDAIRRRG